MESFHPEDTPLGILLEGEGRFEASHSSTSSPPTRSTSPEPHAAPPFAPSFSHSIQARLRALAPPCRINARVKHSRKLSGARDACVRALEMGVGKDSDAHFLEHFRYTIIASQLLDESPDHGVLQSSSNSAHEEGADKVAGQRVQFSQRGLAVTTLVAFLSVCLVKLLHTGMLRQASVIAITFAFVLAAPVLLLYARWNSRETKRQRAVEAVATLMSSLQSFELISGNSLSLIQEVDVVAKGYKFGSPLPPVSRLDDAKTLRRCLPLRRQLFRTYMAMTQNLIDVFTQLQPSVDYEDHLKYLDVYDVPRDATQDCTSLPLPSALDPEALSTLRIVSFRYGIMRRAFLCILLSLRLKHDSEDLRRWRETTIIMERLTRDVSIQTATISNALAELSDFAPSTPSSQQKPPSERLKTQIRKISNLSSGIRSLQAKMAILREESNAALSRADDLTDLGPTLMSQYESIGTDIHALLSDWEAGKTALTTNIIKHERRISLASSTGLRSPASSSFGGLGIVDEDDRRVDERDGSMSPHSSMPSTPRDEEVFEAIAMPKARSTMTRDERIRAMQDERLRAEERREAREAGLGMMRELRSVIGVRKRGRDGSESDASQGPGIVRERVTSI